LFLLAFFYVPGYNEKKRFSQPRQKRFAGVEARFSFFEENENRRYPK